MLAGAPLHGFGFGDFCFQWAQSGSFVGAVAKGLALRPAAGAPPIRAWFNFLDDLPFLENNGLGQAIFFVGYADPDTPGGRLKAAQPGETFIFSPSVGELMRRCEVDDFDLTAHANREDLMEF